MNNDNTNTKELRSKELASLFYNYNIELIKKRIPVEPIINVIGPINQMTNEEDSKVHFGNLIPHFNSKNKARDFLNIKYVSKSDDL